MESILEQQGIITSLECTYQDFREEQVVVYIKFDKEKQSFVTQIQDWKGKYEITKVQLNILNPVLLVKMNNRLKEFEELLT
jgi:ribosomal protein S8